jgi:hypothetical protein
MPDLLTHLVATHFITRAPNLFKNRFVQFYVNYRPLIFLGTIFPDVISKPFQFISWKLYNYGLAFHTPFCVIFACYIFSRFFYIKDRKTTFWIMTGFSFFHIFVDSFQRGIYPGYQLLFPFSLRRYGFNFVRSEMYLVLLIILSIIAVSIEVYFYFKNKYNSI